MDQMDTAVQKFLENFNYLFVKSAELDQTLQLHWLVWIYIGRKLCMTVFCRVPLRCVYITANHICMKWVTFTSSLEILTKNPSTAFCNEIDNAQEIIIKHIT